MAENIDFQFPMKKACSQDIQVTPSLQGLGCSCLVGSVHALAAPLLHYCCLPGCGPQVRLVACTTSAFLDGTPQYLSVGRQLVGTVHTQLNFENPANLGKLKLDGSWYRN